MNKVKFLLSAVTVIAIVGGALAFKAVKLPNANVYCSTFAGTPNCDKVLFTTDSDVSTSANPCSGGFFYTSDDCQSSFTTNNTNPQGRPIQKVIGVTE